MFDKFPACHAAPSYQKLPVDGRGAVGEASSRSCWEEQALAH